MLKNFFLYYSYINNIINKLKKALTLVDILLIIQLITFKGYFK